MRRLGRYEIVDELGRGGAAIVYLARDTATDRAVAVKVLVPHLPRQGELQARFEREIKLAVQLEHPHVVPIFDVGIDGDQPYIVMRLLPGGSLADRITRGRMSLPATLEILRQVASALDAAHRLKIVHRDLKPSNILFDREGAAYLADFGIAKAIDAATPPSPSWVVGTPAFMGPEQFRGQVADGRTDEYALGIVAFVMLTGHLPYEGTTAHIITQQLLEPLPDIRSFNTQFPHSMQAVLERATAKDPAQRYATAGEFVADLAAAVEGWLDMGGITPVLEPLDLAAGQRPPLASGNPAAAPEKAPPEATPPATSPTASAPSPATIADGATGLLSAGPTPNRAGVYDALPPPARRGKRITDWLGDVPPSAASASSPAEELPDWLKSLSAESAASAALATPAAPAEAPPDSLKPIASSTTSAAPAVPLAPNEAVPINPDPEPAAAPISAGEAASTQVAGATGSNWADGRWRRRWLLAAFGLVVVIALVAAGQLGAFTSLAQVMAPLNQGFVPPASLTRSAATDTVSSVTSGAGLPATQAPDAIGLAMILSPDSAGAPLCDVPAGAVIMTLPDRTIVQVLRGRQQVPNGSFWVEVRAPGGQTGWVAEKLLSYLYQPPATPTATETQTPRPVGTAQATAAATTGAETAGASTATNQLVGGVTPTAPPSQTRPASTNTLPVPTDTPVPTATAVPTQTPAPIHTPVPTNTPILQLPTLPLPTLPLPTLPIP